VDIDDLELDAARTHMIEWNAEECRQQWLAELKPHLMQAVNDLAKEGDIPARFRFLANVALQYGLDVITETDLPWITTRVPPGHGQLIAPKEFLKRLGQISEVVLLYGQDLSPWNAESIGRGQYPESSRDALIIPVPSDGQPNVGSYEDREETIDGPLASHFETERYTRSRPEQASLLRATLQLIARAWNNKEALDSLIWRRRSRRISAHIKRAA
jgi:hypothetical protein